jgi:hypothetical protein
MAVVRAPRQDLPKGLPSTPKVMLTGVSCQIGCKFDRVACMRIGTFPLMIGLGFAVAALPAAAEATWKSVQSAESVPGPDGVKLRASLLEKDVTPPRKGHTVGNIAIPENPDPRKLVIERVDTATGEVRDKREFRVPSETIKGDQCSVAILDELVFKDDALVVGFDHQYACGAGEGTSVRYTLDVSEADLRVAEVSFDSASRDAMQQIRVDYRRGAVMVARGRVEDEHPRRVSLRRMPQGKPLATAKLFVVCPQPLKSGRLPDCRP